MGVGEPGFYVPSFSASEVARLKVWHEATYEELRKSGVRHVSYLGLDLVVPPGVFPPTPMSDLLGSVVLDQVRPSDRVLDMGTGSGVNAILAASCAHDVTGVDINPDAVAAAVDNAARNGVASRTRFLVSDLFDAVDRPVDLVIYDPPFRWFTPRDVTEMSIADEGYASLTRFMGEVPQRLNPGGRVLVFFGTSGDMAYVLALMDASPFVRTTVAERALTKEGLTVTYRTFLLTRP